MLALSEQRRKQTTKTIDSSKEQFDETQADNQQKLDEVLAQIDGLERKIPDLNKKVIDSILSFQLFLFFMLMFCHLPNF